MENTIIDKLFADCCDKMKNGEEYGELLKKQSALEDGLRGALTEENRKQFEDFIDLHLGMEYCLSRDYFKEGLKTGLLIVMESLLN